MKNKTTFSAAVIGLFLLASACSNPNETPAPETVGHVASAQRSADCNTGTASDGNYELRSSFIAGASEDSYSVITEFTKPNIGVLRLVSSDVHILSGNDGEILRVRELVYTIDPADENGNDLIDTFQATSSNFEMEEVITVVVDGDYPANLPRKPKVVIIRPGGATTPSSN